MTSQEVDQLEKMREQVKRDSGPVAEAALTQIEYLLECYHEDKRRERITREGW